MVRAPTHLSPSHHMQCIGRAWPQHRSSSSSALLQLPLAAAPSQDVPPATHGQLYVAGAAAAPAQQEQVPQQQGPPRQRRRSQQRQHNTQSRKRH